MGRRNKSLTYKSTPPPPSTRTNRPSLAGSIIEGVASGITFGAGSAVGHRAIDSIMGPRRIEVDTTMPANIQNNNDPCKVVKQQLNECMSNNNDCNEIFQLMKKMNCEL